MMGVAPEGATVWVSRSSNKARKYPFSWELLELDGGYVAINTNNPNKIAYEAIENKMIPELSGYQSIRREVKYGENSRIDILLEEGRGKKQDQPCYVEVKNVHLMRHKGLAEFPDSVTSRGTKHLEELSNMIRAGHRAVMLYIVQRGDCQRFKIADDIDPNYGQALLKAIEAGVDLLCYDCEISTNEVVLRKPLDILL